MNKEANNSNNDNYLLMREIAYTGIFLSLTLVFTMIQIPIYSFLRLDVSIAILLIAREFISFKKVILIGIVAPFGLFLTYFGEIVGISILILLNIFVIFAHEYFFIDKNWKTRIISATLIVITVSLIFTFLNIILFTPIYYSFDYQLIWDNIELFFIIILPFNLLKLTIDYSIFLIIKKQNNW